MLRVPPSSSIAQSGPKFDHYFLSTGGHQVRFTDVAPPFRAACRAKARRYEGAPSARDGKAT
jgi:hypothetical protein